MRRTLSLLRIALRNVLRNRRRTLITLAALLVGVSVMVSVRGVLNGLQSALVENVVKGQTGALQVHRKGYRQNVLASPLTLDFESEPIAEKARAVPGVQAVAPRIAFGGMLAVGDETIFLFNQAIDPAAELKVCPKRGAAMHDAGKFFGAGGIEQVADAVLVTGELEKALRPAMAKTKDPAALLAPDRDGALSGENATIVGKVDLSGPGDRKLGIVRLDVAQRLLKMEGRVTELAVAVDDLSRLEQTKAALQQALGEGYEVHTWEEIASFVVDIRNMQNALLSLVAAVFMLLMLLGVANTMLMSVLDRTREIGTMMAVGVRRQTIVALFLMEAGFIGALGGSLGGALGWGLSSWLSADGISLRLPTSDVPYVIHPFVPVQYLAAVVAIAATGAVLFALYPAWRASRLRPVEALAGG
ncbi:MAG: ABC transporter permease [Deltaproteobacteria bacterium]|nr:ABC transporter permease [Deltaproteobacteria bacterium]